MGMIFNTLPTLEMIAIGHASFQNNWALLQKNASHWDPIFRALGTGGKGSTYAILSAPPLSIRHKSKNDRWQAWLRLLDGNAVGSPGVATQVGGFIADAISNIGQKFSGVDFFIVPSVFISPYFSDLPDTYPPTAASTTYRRCITITTTTIEGLGPR